MLRYMYGDQLNRHPHLAHAMFRDRADQFKARLGWDVGVDEAGEERDEYDALNPLYVIWQRPDGGHGGSLRLLPTTGPTMVNDHFRHLGDRGRIVSPQIWECTRFCLSRRAGPRMAAALMLGGGEIMRNFGVRHFVGVFDARMERIYRLIGSEPEVLGGAGVGRARISIGLWSFDSSARDRVARRAGLSLDISDLWFRRSFGAAGAKLAWPA